jgi:hypothetical protein
VPYDSQVTRTNAQTLLPEDVQHEIIDGIVESFVVMRLARRLPNLSRS